MSRLSRNILLDIVSCSEARKAPTPQNVLPPIPLLQDTFLERSYVRAHRAYRPRGQREPLHVWRPRTGKTVIVTRPGTHSLPRSGNVSNCYLGWSYFQGNDHPFLLEQLLPAAGEGQTAYQLKRRPFRNLLSSIGGGAETDSAWPSWLRVTRSLSNAPSNVDETIRWRMKNGQGVGDQVYHDLSPPLDPIFFLPQETQSRDSGSSGQIPHVSPGVSSIWSYRDPNGSFVPGPTTLPSPSGSGQSSQSSPSGNSAWTSVGHMWIGEKG
ncbi:hypothetical protein DB88DRAFT_482835 [Papiliotrema laurentii]|uniref:Uncharacterized protein n=1 Tax=Papiliotrema laurentii TaxID=5418 RepID=A0AAD9L819_PAPLA|nr:hypothetical protein DB88DRAFT_482835 [Papiliotrema laurentii]